MSGTAVTALVTIAVALTTLAGVAFTALQSRRGSKPDEFRAITTELRKDLDTTRADLQSTRTELKQARGDLRSAVDYIRDLLEHMRRHDLEPPPVSANARYPWED